MLTQNKQLGFTIIELIVSLMIGSVVVLAGVSSLTYVLKSYNDVEIRESALDGARAVFNLIGPDMKMIGNGVPFDQANFRIDDELANQSGTLSLDYTVSHPINITSSNSTSIVFKINETGVIKSLIAAFSPGGTTITLDSTSGLVVGDNIYISSKSIGGDDGFMGTIATIPSATQITISSASWYKSPEASTFGIGSNLEPVANVTYSNSSGNIVRNAGFGDVIVANNASFTVDYLNKSGTTITPPLTEVQLAGELGSIRINLTLTSTKTHKILSSLYSTFTLNKSQTFGLRSFNFSL